MRSLLYFTPALALSLSACGAQKLALPSDPIGKAATCGVVAAADARSQGQQISAALPVDRQGKIVHYALLTGANDGQFEAKKAAAVMNEMQVIQEKVTDGKWQALVQPCEAAFPEASLARDVTLPADALRSEMGCYMLGKFMTKALASQGNAYEAQLLAYGKMGRELDPKIAVTLNKRGIRSEEAREVQRNEALSAAAKLGSPSKVMDACTARYVKA